MKSLYFVQLRSRKYGDCTFVETFDEIREFLNLHGVDTPTLREGMDWDEDSGVSIEIKEVKAGITWSN